jgi:hypothetical protein
MVDSSSDMRQDWFRSLYEPAAGSRARVSDVLRDVRALARRMGKHSAETKSRDASFVSATDLLIDGGYVAFKGKLGPNGLPTLA